MKFEERYQLQVPLGQSDRGTVWSSEDAKLSRKVVVATLTDKVDEETTARFVDQMEKLATLRHANLIRVFDVGKTKDGLPYAGMEVVEGDTLESRMNDGPPMRVDQAVRMTVDLLGALTAIHDAGIAHGDIEPGNVMVKERGGRVTPKLIGFGLNRVSGRGGSEAIDSAHLRSLTYMSPAQAKREVVADAASDVYSVAAILYALLSGRLPRRGADAEAIRAAVAERNVPALADVREELEGAIAEVIDAALSPYQWERFESADAFSKALRAALIRMRNPGALEIVVGERTLDADASDTELSAKRMQAKEAEKPKRPPGAGKLAPTPKAAVSPKLAAASKRTPAALKPQNSVEFPESVDEDELEFEKLSGLLEIKSDAPPRRIMPPPPPGGEGKDEAADPDATVTDSAPAAAFVQQEKAKKAKTPPAKPAPKEAKKDEKIAAKKESIPERDRADAPKQEEAVKPVVIAQEPEKKVSERPPKKSVEKAERAESDAAEERTPLAIEEEGRASSGPPMWAWAAGGLAVAAVLVIAIVATSGEEEPILEPVAQQEPTVEAPAPRDETPLPDPLETSDTAREAVPQPQAAADAGTTPAVEETAVAQEETPQQVVLTLRGVPEGASVRLDGRTMEGTTFELEPRQRRRSVEVRLEGHRTWREAVAGDSSAELDVELEAEERRAARPTRSNRRASARASSNRRNTPAARASSSRNARTPTKARRNQSGRPNAVRDPGF